MLKHISFLLLITMFLFGCKSTKELTDVTETKPRGIVALDSLRGDSTDIASIDSLNNIDTLKPIIIEESYMIMMETKTENDEKSVMRSKPKIKYEIRIDTTKVIEEGYAIVTYFVPDTMRIDKSYVITLRVANTIEKANLDESQPGRIIVDKVRVGSTMKAYLTDVESAFEIKELSTIEQNVEKGSYTQWQWSVKPKKGGKAKVKLRMVITGDINKDIEVYSDSVYIEVPKGYNLWNFLKEHWQWIVSTLVLPFGLWLYNRKKKKKDPTTKRKSRKKK